MSPAVHKREVAGAFRYVRTRMNYGRRQQGDTIYEISPVGQ